MAEATTNEANETKLADQATKGGATWNMLQKLDEGRHLPDEDISWLRGNGYKVGFGVGEDDPSAPPVIKTKPKPNPFGVSNTAKAFGVLGKPLGNVMAVAVKAIKASSHKLVTRAWRVLVVNEDGCFAHWFNTNRPFDDREMTDWRIGERVNLMAQRRATTFDDWQDKAYDNGYNVIEDPEFWPVQCQPHHDIADCGDWGGEKEHGTVDDLVIA